MKKKRIVFFGLFLMLFCSLSGSTQTIRGKIILGASFAQVDGDRAWGYTRVGPALGAAACMPLSKKIFFQLEIMYNMRGAASEVPFLNSYLHYVDAPVLIHVPIKPKWIAQAGLTPGFLVNAQMQDPFSTFDITSNLQKYDLSFTFGAEYKWVEEWAVNVRFNYSALPIELPSFNRVSNSLVLGGWFNNFLTLSIRYTFPLKRAV